MFTIQSLIRTGVINTTGLLRRELVAPSTSACLRMYAKKTDSKKKSSNKCKALPDDDMIKCPKKKEVDVCKLDLTIPPIGYYDIGYCRPPCKPKLKSCPSTSSISKKKKKVCCVIKKSPFWVNPCKKKCQDFPKKKKGKKGKRPRK